MSDCIEVEIVNWEKHNGIRSKDLKQPSWFALNHRIFYDSDLFDLSPEEMAAWIYLLCEASISNKRGHIKLSADHAKTIGRIKPSVLKMTLEKLEQKQKVAVSRPAHGRLTAGTLHDNTVQTIQDTTLHGRPAFDFEAAYERYPKKVGKSKGLENLQKQIKNLKDWHDFQKAVDNYCAYVKVQQTESKFIKQFDTFTNNWKNYVDMEIDTRSETDKWGDELELT